MRVAIALLLTVVAACDEEPAVPPALAPETTETETEQPAAEPWSDAWLIAEGARYLADAEHRRRSMLASLRNHANLYSRTRVSSYGLGDRGWDRLPEWNPIGRTFRESDRAALAAGESPEVGSGSRLWNGRVPETQAEWVALGRRVFFEYPLRADEHVRFGVADAERAGRFGIEAGADGTVPGVVVFRDVDGRDRVGIACAICHTARDGEAVVEGRARRRFDYGALQLEHARVRGRTIAPEMARRMASWGPGRADITEDDSEDPVAIPDLWGLRHQSALTQAGTIEHVGPIALALRQETQLIYANHTRTRPPRVLVWALAMYLYSLEPPQRDAEPPPREVATRGEALFGEHCAECHSNDAYGGQTVRADRVGTHQGLAHGVARGTGRYRPAGLIRVADAAPYFHDGSVATLEDLLGRARLEATYRGALGEGAAPGHEYGLDLGAGDRLALLAFLNTL